MPADVWQEKSDRLCTHLQTSPVFTQAQTVLAYFSFRQEPDLSPLFTVPDHHIWGFSRCVDQTLSWHAWSPKSTLSLQVGTYGILEPHRDAPILEPEDVDLILVPAVACDIRGYRLGYGGGFYDRMLQSPEWAKKLTIATVFEFARLPHLPVDSWDQMLQGVCTERALYF